MKRVIVFGSFDPLHQGHIDFFKQAREKGEQLIVVVAKDSTIKNQKQRDAFNNEKQRLSAVAKVGVVDKAMLGDDDYASNNILKVVDFDILALGYDQSPDDETVKNMLKDEGKEYVELVRLKAYKPSMYKSSYIRAKIDRVSYDMHIHSKYSDGDLMPKEIIDKAKQFNLSGIVIADHNTVTMSDEIKEHANKVDIEMLSGIEVSSQYRDIDIHILGYGRELNKDVFEEGLKEVKQTYMNRVEKMVKLCRQAGYSKIRFEEIKKKKSNLSGAVYASYDVVSALKEHYKITNKEALAMVIKGGKFYVPNDKKIISTRDAISLVHRAGGVAVVAHAGIIAMNKGMSFMKEVLEKFVADGMDGVELFHPLNNDLVVKELKDMINRYDLISSGGSDWHGVGRYDSCFASNGISNSRWKNFLTKL